MQRRPASLYVVAVFTHEHHRADCAGIWCQNPQALGPCAGCNRCCWRWGPGRTALLRTPIIDLALHIVGGSETVLEQARRFLEIRWLSAPASLANLVLLCWLLGVQYARAPVILLVVGNILNIVLDVWLVMGCI